MAITAATTMLQRRAESWSFADQAIVSGFSFLCHVIMARTQVPGEYGLYAIAMGVILFANSLHAALVTYPLLITCPGNPTVQIQRVKNESLGATLTVGLPMATVAMIAAALMGRPLLGVLVAFALVAWQLQETFRRALMAEMRYKQAILGDLVIFGGQAAFIAAAALWNKLSVEVAFGGLALSAISAAGLHAIGDGTRIPGLPASLTRLKLFWPLAKWVLLSNLVSALSLQGLVWALALCHGPAAAAGFQAIANIMNAGNPIILGIGNVLVPAVSARRALGDVAGALRTAWQMAVSGAIPIGIFYVCVICMPETVLSLVYGSLSAYAGMVLPLRLLAVAYFAFYPAQVLNGVLSSLVDTRAAFSSQVAGAMAFFVIGFPAIWAFGLLGAVVAFGAANGFRTASSIWGLSAYPSMIQRAPAMSSP